MVLAERVAGPTMFVVLTVIPGREESHPGISVSKSGLANSTSVEEMNQSLVYLDCSHCMQL